MAGVADVIETTLLDQKAEHQKQFKDPTASKGEKKALAVVGVEEAPKNVASKDVKEADDDVSKAGNLATQLQSAEAAEAKKMVDEAKVQESNMIKHAQEEDHKMMYQEWKKYRRNDTLQALSHQRSCAARSAADGA